MLNHKSPAPAQMFVQINLQKSKLGQCEIGKRIRKLKNYNRHLDTDPEKMVQAQINYLKKYNYEE